MKKKLVLLPFVVVPFLLSNISFAGGVMPKPPSPWMVYVGAFGGYYSANFAYGANYFANQGGGRNQIFNDNTFQQGLTLGGQVGFQYHFRSSYYTGMVFSGELNSDKARLTGQVESLVAPGSFGFGINHEFRLSKNLDLAAILGADITSRTHVYVKAGASCAHMKHKLTTTRSRLFPFPNPFFEQTARESLWGFVLGLGLTHDINRWLSVFAEFDHYDYGNRNLTALDNIAPTAAGVAVNVDRLTQHVHVSANSVRAGLNVKFMDNFHVPTYRLGSISPWMVYAGLFGGYYGANFAYGGNYFTPITNLVFNSSVFQQGFSGGAQVGFQYHFQSPYYAGFVLSDMANSSKAKLVEHAEDLVTINTFDANHEFRLNNTLDLAVILGADIAPRTHVYAKLGASCAQLRHTFFTTNVTVAAAPTRLQTKRQGLWGLVLGLGITHDIGQWVSLFTEFDHYYYGGRNLNALDSVDPNIILTNQRDRLTQHIRASANSVRAGLNVKFMGAFRATAYPAASLKPWMLYIGLLGAYYSADYAYEGIHTFTTIRQLFYKNDAFQSAYSFGGQLGFQYHLQNPFYLGMEFVIMGNGKKARLTEVVDDAISGSPILNLNNEFRIKYNLDFTGVFGIDVADRTHFYTKVGASCARFTDKYFTTFALLPFPSVGFQQVQNKSVWGFLLGFGLSHDFGQRIRVFAEYDHYDYGRNALNSYSNIGFPVNGQFNQIMQRAKITVNSTRIGLNVKFVL